MTVPKASFTPRRAKRAPWHFRLAMHLIRRRIRGGYRLVETARRLGWLNVVVPYTLEEGQTLDVPLYRRENLMTGEEAREYEAAAIALLAEEVKRLPPAPLTLVDCGADIGLVSTLLSARCPNVKFLPITACTPCTPFTRTRSTNPSAGICENSFVNDSTSSSSIPVASMSDARRPTVVSSRGSLPGVSTSRGCRSNVTATERTPRSMAASTVRANTA